jgi:hypothetical protein
MAVQRTQEKQEKQVENIVRDKKRSKEDSDR